MDVTKFNLEEHFEAIKSHISTCAFITFDAEFTGLLVDNDNRNSLFDSNKQRYDKMRAASPGVVASQVGLSFFQYNREGDAYRAATYTFHLCPQGVARLYQTCTFQGQAITFLTRHNFNFNQMFYEGLAYLNRDEEATVVNRVNSKEELIWDLDFDESDRLDEIDLEVNRYALSKPIENDQGRNYEGSTSFCYFLAKQLRKISGISVNNHGTQIFVKKLVNGEKPAVGNDRAIYLSRVTGFSRVVKLLESAKKPLVLHNGLSDLVIYYHQFVGALPKSYETFKNNIIEIFPTLYDTKQISNDMKFLVKRDEFCKTSLEGLYKFFKDDKGRHIALFSPAITLKEGFDTTPKFHQAGWDSFCTGYCFIRLCHWAASSNMNIQRHFTLTEHMSAIIKYRNQIMVSRASQAYMHFGGKDPPSIRPEYLQVERVNNQVINVAEVKQMLSTFGSVDVKRITPKCALVAVMNDHCARRILTDFKVDGMRVTQYRALRHSRALRFALWSGLLISAGGLLGIAYKKL